MSGMTKLSILSTHVDVLSGIAALIFIALPSDVLAFLRVATSSSSATLPV